MDFEKLSEESTKDLKTSFEDYQKEEKNFVNQIAYEVASQAVKKMSTAKKIKTLILVLFLFYSLALGFISLFNFVCSIFSLIF